jgi:hypothetical protein
MRLVKPTGSPCLRNGPAIRVEVRWKHWPCLFLNTDQAASTCERSNWSHGQQIVAEYPEQLLCGLFHSDGCRIQNWATQTLASGEIKRYEYLRHVFADESEDTGPVRGAEELTGSR